VTNPYEPPRAEAAATSSSARPDACHVCGTVLSQAAMLYDEGGRVTCQRCLLAAQAEAGLARVAEKLRRVAYGAPAFALLSFVFNPLTLFSWAAIFNGLYVLRALREADTRRRLERSLGAMRAAAIVGVALGTLSLALRLLFSTLRA
jgi:hypothetical protein